MAMLTADKLREFGADVDAGLTRCMNNEAFYITLVGKVIADNRLDLLRQQLADHQLDAAFETAHALKGMYSNLSLDPLTKPVSEMTELLRGRKDVDYSAYLNEAKAQFEALCAL
ncbi:MAG: Hpt domain-containing protein [Ruminococcus sp.]|nr:Hpt domain-containing protein [Ruminococcus sp.]